MVPTVSLCIVNHCTSFHWRSYLKKFLKKKKKKTANISKYECNANGSTLIVLAVIKRCFGSKWIQLFLRTWNLLTNYLRIYFIINRTAESVIPWFFFSTFTISISNNYFLTALFNFYTATTTILRLKIRNITRYISGIYRSLFLGIAITALWKNYDCNLRFICKQKKNCLSIKFLQTKALAVLHEPRNL